MAALQVLSVVGARPNFIKIAPIAHELAKCPGIEHVLVHTGQHYDANMADWFFRDLDVPEPDFNLDVGSGSHAQQTAAIMVRLERVLLDCGPDLVLVVGDVNSTLAGTLVAAKLNLTVAHVEAGLRSFDRTMPEEVNRVITDALSAYLFVPSRDAGQNLIREGISPDRIHFVGNVVIDTLLRHIDQATAADVPSRYGLRSRQYALLTLHRPSNTDTPAVLAQILEALAEVQDLLPVVLPLHPRTAKRLREFGLWGRATALPRLVLMEPLPYVDFLSLVAHARLVMTDSGGIQEETTVLGIPCLTLRPNTERPITVTQGTNRVIGNSPGRIVSECHLALRREGKSGQIPELWDGHAASRIVAILAKHGQSPNAVEKAASGTTAN